MKRAARLTKELVSELSGEQGGDIQVRAGLEVRVAELASENRKFRAALAFVANGQDATVNSFAKRAVQIARDALKD